MPSYTLHYFGVRNLAEVSRLIFAAAGQEFTDHRIKFEEWADAKKNTKLYPFGTVPTLEIDDVLLPESMPIARYLASEFGLAGKDNLEKARCDVIVDSFKDIRVECKPVTPIYMTETDEAKIAEMKKEIFEGKVAAKLAILEEILKSNSDGKGYFVGNGLTWADLALVDVGFTMLCLYPSAFDNSPALKALYDRVTALPAVKKHCDTRPESPL